MSRDQLFPDWLNELLRTELRRHARGLYLDIHNNTKMRLINSLLPQLLLLGSSLVSAASWSFEDASVSIQAKGSVDRANKERYVDKLNSNYRNTNN